MDTNRHEWTRMKRWAGSPCHGLAVAVMSCACLVVSMGGCGSESKQPTTRPLSMRERQDQMLAHPGDYKMDEPNTDITGGGIGHFDKDAFNKDMDHVFNP